MLVKDLDGNTHNWLLAGNTAYGTYNKSALHLRARAILKEEYPTLQLLEEVPMPLKKGVTLYMDFYLPLKKICVEVHGEQHYRFIPFYHSNLISFTKAKKRDLEKSEWCEQNAIRYVVFPFDATDDEWRTILNEE